MRRHTIAVPAGSTAVIQMDYLQGIWSLQFVVVGGPTYSVSFTADDVNNTEGSPAPIPTWFPFPAALTGAVTSQFFPAFTSATTPQPISAIQVAVTVAGTVYVTILQPSGADGI